ncbi:hypothetical protein N7456_010987 [Penicillium angulare]|uniref:MARVEL domain-containing protein n=1 Tax=Penicillium angulare TaxID=116970 RepID=A0A9W9ET40_9EURO|nr:hypothetical protein N7456_010987 [Penicillium angulare]
METFFNNGYGMVSYVTRFLQFFSSIIILGITGWAVRETKSLTVIYSLTIAVVTIVFSGVATLVGCMIRQKRWHIFPMFVTDAVLSYLWLTSFIFLALDFNRHSCRASRWNGEVVCSRQYAAEAFSFIAFFATLITLGLEVGYINSPRTNHVPTGEEMERNQQLTERLNDAGVL